MLMSLPRWGRRRHASQPSRSPTAVRSAGKNMKTTAESTNKPVVATSEGRVLLFPNRRAHNDGLRMRRGVGEARRIRRSLTSPTVRKARAANRLLPRSPPLPARAILRIRSTRHERAERRRSVSPMSQGRPTGVPRASHQCPTGFRPEASLLAQSRRPVSRGWVCRVGHAPLSRGFAHSTRLCDA
jgi:hypothetical protein